MAKEYTVVTYKRDYNNKVVYAIMYYWDGKVKKYDQVEIPYYYFYALSWLEFDPNKFKTVKGFKNVFGQDVSKIIPKENMMPEDYKKIQETLKGKTFETDVRAIDRFLWEEKPKFSKNIRKWYIDIEILRNESGQYSSVADAENKVASIVVYDNFAKKYYLFILGDKKSKEIKGNREIWNFTDEYSMLEAFLKAVEQLNPDYFTGWNVVGFDIPYLLNRMNKMGIDNRKISPLWSVRMTAKMYKSSLSYSTYIKGRGIIDLMEIARQFWMGTDVGYSLEAISQKFLGQGKIKIGDIDRAYREEYDKFIEYNVKDVELCVLLDEKCNLIKDMQEFQDIISINLDDTPIVGRIINSYIKQHTDIVLDDSYGKEDFELPGGYVHPSGKGIFTNIYKYDFASHYPSVIRTYNISTDTIVYNPTEEQKKDLICFKCYYRKVDEEGTSGFRIVLDNEKRLDSDLLFEVYFKKNMRGCITSMIDTLTVERLKLKKAGNKSRSTVLKRMLNSVYGQFPYKYSRFYNKDCAKAITLICQWLTRNIIDRLEKKGIGTVLLSDTDSITLNLTKDHNPKEVEEVTKEVFDKSMKEHNLDKVYSNLELEDIIDKMILFGVKKKYASYVKGKIKVQGLEMIRKDFPEALKEFQTEMIKCIFEKDKPTLTDLKSIKGMIEVKIRKAIIDKNPIYYSMPTVIKKPIEEYENETAEKKALRNSGLKISINETFYILPCQGKKDLAFKSIEELNKFNYIPDYERITDSIFNNIGIFEGLFIQQKTLGEW